MKHLIVIVFVLLGSCKNYNEQGMDNHTENINVNEQKEVKFIDSFFSYRDSMWAHKDKNQYIANDSMIWIYLNKAEGCLDSAEKYYNLKIKK